MSTRLNWEKDKARHIPVPKFPETTKKERQEDLEFIESTRVLREMFDFLSEQDLTDWDRKFLRNIKPFLERLTPKQLNVFNNMYLKYGGRLDGRST